MPQRLTLAWPFSPSSIVSAGRQPVTYASTATVQAGTRFTGLHRSKYCDLVFTTVGLSAYWRLGESSGVSAADSSGNGHTGTYAGSPTLGATGLILKDTDTAVTFGGTNSVDVGLTSLVAGTSISVEAWISSSSAATSSIFDYRTGTNHTGANLFFTAGKVQFWVGTGVSTSSVENHANDPNTCNDGLTHHFVGTFDGTTILLYRDGQLVATQPFTATLGFGATPTVRVANDAQGRHFVGTLDDVAVYDGLLSASTILTHYEAGAYKFARTATASPKTKLSGADIFTSSETSMVRPGTRASGADIFTSSETATIKPGTKLSGADSSTHAETASMQPKTKLSGADAFIGIATAAMRAGTRASGADNYTSTETSSVKAGSRLSGADVSTHIETASVKSGSRASAGANRLLDRRGSTSCGTNTSADWQQAVQRSGSVRCAPVGSGFRLVSKPRTASVRCQLSGSAASFGHFFHKAGTVTCGSRHKGFRDLRRGPYSDFPRDRFLDVWVASLESDVSV